MKSLFHRLIPYFIAFLCIEALVRISIGVREMDNLGHGVFSLLQSMGMGIVMDCAAFLYILPLLVIIQLCIPHKLNGIRIQVVLYAIFLFAMFLTAVSQWLFWDELTSRFNFIAVDYLVYMDEVVGNIQESYPVVPILLVIGIIAAIGGYIYSRWHSNHEVKRINWQYRGAVLVSVTLLTGLSFLFISENTGEYSENRYENEIAKNGFFSLFAAFSNNELPYENFYITADNDEAMSELRQHLSADGYRFTGDGITRHITSNGEESHPNIVLITVESLSADYMRAFGNTENLTPNLDQLAKESLFFTDLYATGTRTVYGLSAITLSIPPIPGNAIVRRPQNEGLFSLGSMLNTKGYDSTFFYGGYGYFDNMNAFFSGNGYNIIDRSNLTGDEISFANIWGVADGDIYARVLKENDAKFAKGRPFFDMIMTTSNHQPFTYPDGKIDIPSGSGRRGGIKYTDYAIGEFISEAKKRPWFGNTIFVIVADHTAGSSGKMELTPDKHHIPMIFYAPRIIAPQVVDTLASQIDLSPTLLGVMNMKYDSRFYGRDLMRAGEPRAFIANYQRVGLLKPDSLTILKPGKAASMYRMQDGQFVPESPVDKSLLSEAVAYFQHASRWRELNQATSSTTTKN